MRRLATLGALALFGALLWYGVSSQEQVECELCITFKGRSECRIGRGEDRAQAAASAATAACAVLGSGVTDAMQCNATPPASIRCRTL
jgi:hypothetical protein